MTVMICLIYKASSCFHSVPKPLSHVTVFLGVFWTLFVLWSQFLPQPLIYLFAWYFQFCLLCVCVFFTLLFGSHFGFCLPACFKKAPLLLRLLSPCLPDDTSPFLMDVAGKSSRLSFPVASLPRDSFSESITHTSLTWMSTSANSPKPFLLCLRLIWLPAKIQVHALLIQRSLKASLPSTRSSCFTDPCISPVKGGWPDQQKYLLRSSTCWWARHVVDVCSLRILWRCSEFLRPFHRSFPLCVWTLTRAKRGHRTIAGYVSGE